MASPTDYKFPGTCVSISGSNSSWSNPINVADDDSDHSTVNLTAAKPGSQTLRLTNFGFTSADIPAGAVILGIEFEIERKASSSSATYVNDYQIKLRITSGQVGSNLANASLHWPTSDTVATYGGATNLCGYGTWTQEKVVSSDFGIDILVYGYTGTTIAASIQFVHLRIYFAPKAQAAQMML
jgi:hypothetical protein